MKTKNFFRNLGISFLTVLLLNLAFTAIGLFILSLIKIKAVDAVIISLLFCAMLFVEYKVGKKLSYVKHLDFLSIVFIPIIILAFLFGAFIVEIPVVSMLIQYPAAVWGEAFNISAPEAFADSTGLEFYGLLAVHYFVCLMAMFIGAWRNKPKAEN